VLSWCIDDADLFNDLILQRSPYWSSAGTANAEYPGQREWCELLATYHTICIETGNAVGKDYWVGGVVPHWLWTRPQSLVIVTGPGQSVLGSITWKEIRRAIFNCPFWPWPLEASVTEGIRTSPHMVTVAPGHMALGFSTTSVERASGQHAGNLLVIVEEASGVEDDVWEAIDSLGASKIIAIGNPLREDGGFARLCDQGDDDARNGIAKHRAVCHVRVPSTASPHAHLERSPVGLASGGWLEAMARKWGRDSSWFYAHVLAIRPKISAQALLPEPWLDWALACSARRAIMPPGHPVLATRRIACDLGEGVGRDSTCVLVRDDWGVVEVEFGREMGLPEAAECIARKASDYGVPPLRITYDRVGVGRDFPLHLQRHGLQDALGYAGAGKPRSTDFKNLRSEAAWKLRQRLDPSWLPGGLASDKVPFAIPHGPFWPRMREELKTLQYKLVGRKTSLIDKEDHRTVLGHSPDLADALVQSFAFD
jgi:hypothetical protein